MRCIQLLIILFVIGTQNNLSAQLIVADSLQQLLSANVKNDSGRVDLLIELAAELTNQNPEKALTFINEALKFSKEISYKKGIADAYNQTAAYYSVLSELEKVKEYSIKSLATNEEINNKKGVAINYRNIGKVCYFKGDIDTAMYYFNRSLLLSIEIKDSLIMCYNYASLGTNISDMGDYVKALEYEKKALDIARKINNKEAISFALNNLGVIYDLKGDYPSALEYYQESFKIDESRKDYKGAAVVASNIALILQFQGQFNEGIAFCERGVEYAKKIGYKTGLTYNYENMALIYRALGDIEKAFDYQKKRLKLQKEIGNKQGITIAYRDIADLYFIKGTYDEAMEHYKIALKRSKEISYKRVEISANTGISNIYFEKRNYPEAYKHAKLAYKLAKEVGNVELISKSAEAVAQSSKALGKTLEAYNAFVDFKLMSDSLLNEKNIKKIATLEYSYKIEKEQELLRIEQAEKDKIQEAELKKEKRVRNTFVGGFIIVILFASVILNSFRQSRKANKLLALKNNEIENQSEELRVVNESLVELSQFKHDMSNMIVHDLKNPLSALMSIDLIKEEDKKSELIKHATSTMMNLVQNMLDVYKYESTEIALNKESIDLKEVIESAIEDLKYIAKIRKIDFKITLENKIQLVVDFNIIQRVLGNLLSNALKFSKLESVVKIEALLIENKKVRISVYNNGPGIPSEKQDQIFHKFNQVQKKNIGKIKSTGLGLTFCKIAIDAHQGTIGVISEKTEGVTFWFELPNAKETTS